MKLMAEIYIRTLHHLQILRHGGFLEFPFDVHGVVAVGGDVIDKAEAVEGGGVAESIFFFLADKEEDSVVGLGLLGVTTSSLI